MSPVRNQETSEQLFEDLLNESQPKVSNFHMNTHTPDGWIERHWIDEPGEREHDEENTCDICNRPIFRPEEIGDGICMDCSIKWAAKHQLTLPAVPVLADANLTKLQPEASGGDYGLEANGEARRSTQERNLNVATAGNPIYEMPQASNRDETPDETGQTDTETISGFGMQDVRERTEADPDKQSVRPKISSQMEGENSRSQRQNPETGQMREMRQPNQTGRPSFGLHEAAGSNVVMSDVPRSLGQTISSQSSGTEVPAVPEPFPSILESAERERAQRLSLEQTESLCNYYDHCRICGMGGELWYGLCNQCNEEQR